MDNTISVFLKEDDTAVLKYPRCNIETTAYIGKNGLTNEKIEGDLKTPIGKFELGKILGTNLTVKNKNGLEFLKINENMYWIDDTESKYYNQLINISEVEKDWNSAEHLIDYPIQYEYLIEIKTNPSNIKGKGSAIFLHCSNHRKTVGCIAVDREIMQELIENIDIHTKIEIKSKACNGRMPF